MCRPYFIDVLVATMNKRKTHTGTRFLQVKKWKGQRFNMEEEDTEFEYIAAKIMDTLVHGHLYSMTTLPECFLVLEGLAAGRTLVSPCPIPRVPVRLDNSYLPYRSSYRKLFTRCILIRRGPRNQV